jgi:hypothetical protein
MHVELELTSLRLALQEEELNSTDIPQRLHALLALEEQRSYALDNLKKRQQTIKNILIRGLNQLLLQLVKKYFMGFCTC